VVILWVLFHTHYYALSHHSTYIFVDLLSDLLFLLDLHHLHLYVVVVCLVVLSFIVAVAVDADDVIPVKIS
jgi:hypothetical protein